MLGIQSKESGACWNKYNTETSCSYLYGIMTFARDPQRFEVLGTYARTSTTTRKRGFKTLPSPTWTRICSPLKGRAGAHSTCSLTSRRG